MSNRIVSAVALLLLLSAFGCGQMHRSLAPQTDAETGGSVSDPVLLARLDATDAALEAEDDDLPAWPAHATPITEPTTITEPGDYRLAADLRIADGDGILVRASHVRLWLGDHWLRGPGNKAGRAIVLDGARHSSVRGGHVERFGLGVAALGSSECSIRGLDIRGGDDTADPAAGNPPQIGIMLVNSSRNRIARNHLRGVNLGIFVRGGGSYENVIHGNHAEAGSHGLLGICYNPAPGGDPAGPRHDRVTRNVLNRFDTGIVTSEHSANNHFRFNSIRYFTSAYVDHNGTNVFERNEALKITP